MQCAYCANDAERACTRCGRFFCHSHGGDRLVSEGAGRGHRIVTRDVCNSCTPNQTWMATQQAMGIALFVLILLVILFFFLGR